MTLDGALGALRALTERARESADVCVAVPFEVADGIARLGTEARVADLLATLDALDLADCSPRMIQRRVVLGSRLRLDATDDEARAQTANLLATAKLRRRLGNAMGDAIEADNATAAYRMRSLLIAADDESAGWQEDALRALDGPERKGQKRD